MFNFIKKLFKKKETNKNLYDLVCKSGENIDKYSAYEYILKYFYYGHISSANYIIKYQADEFINYQNKKPINLLSLKNCYSEYIHKGKKYRNIYFQKESLGGTIFPEIEKDDCIIIFNISEKDKLDIIGAYKL